MSKAVVFLGLSVGPWIGLRSIAFGVAPGAMAQAPLAEPKAPPAAYAMGPALTLSAGF